MKMEITEIEQLKHIEKVLRNLINDSRNKIKYNIEIKFNTELKKKLIIAYAEIISSIIILEDKTKFKFQEKIFNGK